MPDEIITNNIITDFKLPNHSAELYNANSVLEKHKSVFRKIRVNENISEKEHTELFDEIVRVLDYVGRLSMKIFDIQDELEESYKMKFLRTPELGKKLWYDHYSEIHHPYNTVKNRCFQLLDELDEEYIRVNKKYPPNWKI